MGSYTYVKLLQENSNKKESSAYNIDISQSRIQGNKNTLNGIIT